MTEKWKLTSWHSPFISLVSKTCHIYNFLKFQQLIFQTCFSTLHIKSWLHSLEQATGNIGLYVNVIKIKFLCYKQKGVIFTLSGKPLKLVNQFINPSCYILSTENDVNIHLMPNKGMECYWQAIDCMEIWSLW